MARHVEAGYNKFTANGKGTLVGNWAEERTLRDFTGVGRYVKHTYLTYYRAVMQKHVPKKHLDFETPIVNPNVQDTKGRIFGEMKAHEMTTETRAIGTGKNPADAFPKIGLKKKNFEAAVS